MKEEEKKEKEEISVSSAQHLPEVLWFFRKKKKHLPEVQTRKKEKRDPLSTNSVSSAPALARKKKKGQRDPHPEVQTQGQG